MIEAMKVERPLHVVCQCDKCKTESQEPVAWADHGVVNWIADKQFKHASLLYTTPPQRTWVGLTEDDKVLIKHDANFNQFMTAGEYADKVQQLTEARLKDKNT